MATSPNEDACSTVFHLDRWRAGDDSAFTAIHARLDPLLRARLQRTRSWELVRRHHQIDDVLQEVWSRAATAVRDSFRHEAPGSLLAFVGTIADRTLVSLVRACRAKKRGCGEVASLGTSFDSERPLPRRSAPATPTSSARANEIVRAAREELSEHEFEAWSYVELQQYTKEEAALAMRRTGSSVRGLILRGKAKLIARLDRWPQPKPKR